MTATVVGGGGAAAVVPREGEGEALARLRASLQNIIIILGAHFFGSFWSCIWECGGVLVGVCVPFWWCPVGVGVAFLVVL